MISAKEANERSKGKKVKPQHDDDLIFLMHKLDREIKLVSSMNRTSYNFYASKNRDTLITLSELIPLLTKEGYVVEDRKTYLKIKW